MLRDFSRCPTARPNNYCIRQNWQPSIDLLPYTKRDLYSEDESLFTKKHSGNWIKLFLFNVFILLCCAPSQAWEEADSAALSEKMNIMSALITSQAEKLDMQILKDSLSGQNKKSDMATLEKAYSNFRAFCLLQSISIDVLHRYLELNPRDSTWKQTYPKLRDELTVCPGSMYAAGRQIQR